MLSFILKDSLHDMKQLHIPIKTLVLLLFIASFAFSTKQVNAEEEKKAYRAYQEISVSSGHISYAEPETWNNSQYSSVSLRDINQVNNHISFFLNLEATETSGQPSDIDGLIRTSDYQKFGFGYIFNASKERTTFFIELGVGLIGFQHYIEEGDDTLQYSENATSEYRVVYENGLLRNDKSGAYLHIAFGIKIKDRHKLAFYIQPVSEGTFEVIGNPREYSSSADDNATNETDNFSPVPDKIVNGMVGIRYSLILPSFW